MGVAVTVIDADDYFAIYFDNELLWSGPRYTNFYDILELCQHQSIELVGKFECSLEWFDEVGYEFPPQLRDVKIGYMGKAIPIFEYMEKTQ